MGALVWRAPGGVVARWTSRADGDLGHGGAYVEHVHPDVDARRRAVLDRTWSWVRQVHGDSVATVTAPGDRAGAMGDGLVSGAADAAVAVLTADCAAVALASHEGVYAAVHAGWRGAAGGVLERAVEAMRGLGASRPVAAVGPCIGPECYAFGAEELDAVVDTLGPSVRATTSDGGPALNLRAAVVASLRRAGVDEVDLTRAACTACSPEYFSYRARHDAGRQALVVWRP